MSDESKAPGWSVREIRIHERWPVYAVGEGDRLIVQTFDEPDARRIVEAVNGLAEARRERDELRAELAAAQAKIVNVQADRDHVIRQRNEALASLGAVRCERDELRAELAALRERTAVEHHGDPEPRVEPVPASALTALVQAAERLTATIERHEVMLGIEAPEPDDDEITKLRALAGAVADWLEAEAEADSLQDGSAYDLWDRLGDAAAVAVLGDSARWEEAPAALRALSGGER